MHFLDLRKCCLSDMTKGTKVIRKSVIYIDIRMEMRYNAAVGYYTPYLTDLSRDIGINLQIVLRSDEGRDVFPNV